MKPEQLELLGFNKYEALAFEALSRLGKAGASDISRESGVPYGRIYDVLDTLIAKNLVKLIPEKAKRYTLSGPEVLRELIDKQKAQLDTLRKEAEEIKQEYEGEEVVFIAKGKRNFYKLTHALPDPKKTDFRIKYTVEWQPTWARNEKENLNKGFDVRNLVRSDKDTMDNIRKYFNFDKRIKMRSFKNSGVAAEICDDYAWFALIKSNTLVVIKDKPFIELMQQLFKDAWKLAPEVQ